MVSNIKILKIYNCIIVFLLLIKNSITDDTIETMDESSMLEISFEKSKTNKLPLNINEDYIMDDVIPNAFDQLTRCCHDDFIMDIQSRIDSLKVARHLHDDPSLSAIFIIDLDRQCLNICSGKWSIVYFIAHFVCPVKFPELHGTNITVKINDDSPEPAIPSIENIEKMEKKLKDMSSE
jgi:hypothetical protein